VLTLMGLEVQTIEPDAISPGDARYDVIVSEGAVSDAPAAWTNALAEGGRLGLVVRDGPVGKARLYTRLQGDVAWREIFDATPPYLAGFEPKPEFAF
jgi:protein-L-isoaspartate(D-aspartate) O-methyltransferase